MTLGRALHLLISVGVIFLIYKYLYKEDTREIILILDQINTLTFFLSIFTLSLAHYFASKKYSLITNMLLNPLQEIQVGYINYFSALFANVIPFGPSADLCRITMLKRNHKIDISTGLIISILDRCSSIFCTIVVGVLLLLIQATYIDQFNKIIILMLFWVCMLFIFLMILFLPKTLFFIMPKNFTYCYDNLKKHIWSICFNRRIIVLTLIHMFFISLSILLCAQSILGNEINVNFVLLSPFFQIIQSVPLFFGGWGIREGVFLYFIPEVEAVLTQKQIFIISLLVGFSILFSTLPSLFFFKKIIDRS